jgi:GPH family glycoside/pentoside/hexuronide:cation symporter
VSARWGKQRVYYAGASAWIVASIAIFFVPRGQVTVLYGLGLLASAGVSVCYLIPWSLLPDVIELDELETGQRREGIYYGFFVFLQKLGISLGLAASNLVLDVTGYVKPDYPGAALAPIPPEAVLTSLRVFVSFIPAIILLLSFIMVARYPITRQRHAEIRAALAARRQGDDG